MMMMMTMMANINPYWPTKSHIWDFVHMGFSANAMVIMMMMMKMMCGMCVEAGTIMLIMQSSFKSALLTLPKP